MGCGASQFAEAVPLGRAQQRRGSAHTDTREGEASEAGANTAGSGHGSVTLASFSPDSPSLHPATATATATRGTGTDSARDPNSLSRPSSGRPPAASRQPSTERDVHSSNAPPLRSRTFTRRNSFGGGVLPPALTEENAWRNPNNAAELIASHSADDPQAFRDQACIYWRMENVPQTGSGEIPARTKKAGSPPPTDAAASQASVSLPGATSHTPPPSPPLAAAATPPVASASSEQSLIFLSLGPSSGAGDRIGCSELRPNEPSISFYPMLLPSHALDNGDPSFSLQVQVWQKRILAPSAGATPTVTMALLGYLDATVRTLFASYEKGQGLLLKSPPASVMNGQPVIPLHNTMLIVDYIQFYAHTTPAVTAIPSRWPRELCTPQSDCLWRGQVHAIKLAPNRGCPHPNAAGSMSPIGGALMLSFKDQMAVQGSCFFQMFRWEQPDAEQNESAETEETVSQAAVWQLVHTSEFISLSRNPKFAEFQRPIADVCAGDYDRPLLLQVVLSHDTVRMIDVCSRMQPDSMHAEPASSVTQAIRAQGLAVCGLAQGISNLRELLAGKAKVKLYPPGLAPFPSTGPLLPFPSDESPHPAGPASASLQRSHTFTFEPILQLDDSSSVLTAAPPSAPLFSCGTLAFNISQIFSSRASLEALARSRLAEAGLGPDQDGFDSAGVVRSSALLASMLPVGIRKGHHRPTSQMRRPSQLHALASAASSDSDSFSSPLAPLLRSKTHSSPSSASLFLGGERDPLLQGTGQGAQGISLLEKLGIASDAGVHSERTRSRKDRERSAGKR